MPAHRSRQFNAFEETSRGIYATGDREQKPVEGRIDDADGIMTDDVRIVFRIHPCAASELNQTAGIQQHSPEIRDGRPSARRMADRVAKDPEQRDEDKRHRPQI